MKQSLKHTKKSFFLRKMAKKLYELQLTIGRTFLLLQLLQAKFGKLGIVGGEVFNAAS